MRSPTLGQLDTVLVLLFEGRTSCSTSYFMCTSCGKPSTWFPHGGLVEWLVKKIKKIKNFQKKSFSQIFENLRPHTQETKILLATSATCCRFRREDEVRRCAASRSCVPSLPIVLLAPLGTVRPAPAENFGRRYASQLILPPFLRSIHRAWLQKGMLYHRV